LILFYFLEFLENYNKMVLLLGAYSPMLESLEGECQAIDELVLLVDEKENADMLQLIFFHSFYFLFKLN